MIKQFVLILTVLISCTQVRSQSKFSPEWNIGIGVGPTFSSMSIVPADRQKKVKTKMTLQYHGGVSVRYITEHRLGLIAELNYSQLGWETQYQDTDHPEFKHTHTLNYLEIPFLSHIYFGSNKVRCFVNLGPKIGFLIGEKEKFNDELNTWLNSTDESIIEERKGEATELYNKEADKKFDYGIMAGLGLELRTGIGNFALEGRYYLGFGDIYNSRKDDIFSRSANRVISARLTYFIKAF